jgi:hypothetical protein
LSSGYRLIAQVAPLAVLWLALQTDRQSQPKVAGTSPAQGYSLRESA